MVVDIRSISVSLMKYVMDLAFHLFQLSSSDDEGIWGNEVVLFTSW